MSKSTISTFELFQMFPDAEAARVYMEGKRWPDGAVCPACDEAKRKELVKTVQSWPIYQSGVPV